MADYKVPPKPAPDMDAGRSAAPKGGPMSGSGQNAVHGAMGKHTKTGDMMPEGTCGGKHK